MRVASKFVLPIGLAVGVSGGLLLSGASRAGAADGPKVAVVNVLAVMEDSPQMSKVTQNDVTRRKGLRDWRAAEEEKFRKVASDIDALPRNDPSKRTKTDQFLRDQGALEVEMKIKVAHADEDYGNDLEAMYAEVRSVIRQVASESGYSLVLMRTDDRVDIRGGFQDLKLHVALRPVVWAEPTMDITEQSKARIRATKPPTPPVTPPPGPPPADPSMGGTAPPPAMR